MIGDPRIAIVWRELAALRSEKTILLAIVIQLFIAAFSSFLVVGLVAMYDPTGMDGGQIEIGVAGEAADDLVESLEAVDGVVTTQYEDDLEARNDFLDGSLDATVFAFRGEGDELRIQATAPDEGIRSTVIVVQLREALMEVERIERADRTDRLEFEPLAVPDGGDSSPYFGFTYTLLLPVLLLLPVFISGSIAVDSVSEELERGTLELLRAAPLSLTGIVDAKLAATASLAPLQAALWIALLRLNGIAIANVTALLVLVLALAVAVVVVGLGIALVAPDRRQAQLLYSFGVLAAFLVAAVLPEHPANTIAKLAIESATVTTWAHWAFYLVLGVLLLAVTRKAIDRIDPDQLGGAR